MTKNKSCLAATLTLLIAGILPAHAAEEDTVQAILPWDADGRVFQVDTGTMMFVGALHGVLYVQSSQGDIHEAFVMCPVTQTVNLESGASEATAHCEITASADDVAYARMSCNGTVGDCNGSFTLVDGEGEFAGISGSGKLRVRSPFRALVSGVAAGTDIRIGSGLAVIRDLEYRIP